MNKTETNKTETETGSGSGRVAGSHLVTAFLAGVVAIQAFTLLGSPPRARADMTIKESTISAMTTRTTLGNELMYVVDDRSEQLLVYSAGNVGGAGGIQLLDRQSLPQMFSAARAQVLGVRLDPLRGPDQPVLLRRPRREQVDQGIGAARARHDDTQAGGDPKRGDLRRPRGDALREIGLAPTPARPRINDAGMFRNRINKWQVHCWACRHLDCMSGIGAIAMCSIAQRRPAHRPKYCRSGRLSPFLARSVAQTMANACATFYTMLQSGNVG